MLHQPHVQHFDILRNLKLDNLLCLAMIAKLALNHSSEERALENSQFWDIQYKCFPGIEIPECFVFHPNEPTFNIKRIIIPEQTFPLPPLLRKVQMVFKKRAERDKPLCLPL